jgi:hypothetical protein
VPGLRVSGNCGQPGAWLLQRSRSGSKIDDMPRRARHRVHMMILVISCLLFQQVAVAAYLCPVEQGAAVPAAVAPCADMPMDVATDVPALCVKHCDPDRYLVTDGGKLTVPPLAVSPPEFAPALAHAASRLAVRADVPLVRSGPPPRLRFCSLLI